jgi:2-(1,2-epoxy-1,2-dihydrophenyl)acetyl-CoA isomerase
MNLALCHIDEKSLIATVTVNRPEVLNALDAATAQALQAVVAPLAARTDLRCIVLNGAGRAFMAGGDLAGFAADFDKASDTVNALLDALECVIAVFRHHPAPVLASVHGAVAGAGVSLVAACDLVVAAENTQFLLAYNKIGAPPDCGGSYFLPRLIGERKAAALMYLSETWSAAQAKDNGLINRVVRDDQLASTTAKLAETIAQGPTSAFSQYKALVRDGHHKSLSEQLAAERKAFCDATKTDDFRAGVTAFIARAKVTFKGR